VQVECNSIIDCKDWADEPFTCSPGLMVGYVVISVFLGLGLLYLLISLAVILALRKRQRVKTAGFAFLLVACISSIIGLVSVFLTYGKVDTSLCMIHNWFFFVSLAVLVR
jgi:hypothetical protein